ncbi:hypothetical protein GCM10027185_47200 [Spirosoma pulveris]
MPLPFVDPPGIVFFKGSWKDVLAEAQRQNKPVFLDVYTTWCPPCKRMAIEAFPNPKVGARYNVHFINYQLDAETGEGIAIARQYLVASYPTSLFIAPNGDLIHRAVGYGGINAMLVQADHVLSLPRLKPTVAKGDKAYAEGKRDPGFLKKYLQTRQALNRPTSDVLDAYLDALPESERTAAETVRFVAGTIESTDTRAFDLLIANRPSLLTTDPAEESLSKVIFSALERILNSPSNQVGTRTNNDAQTSEKGSVNCKREAPTDWEPALVWAERSIRLYRTHNSLHTYAQLLRKLGRTQDAINAQREAIVEAAKEGWPVRDYEDELAEMSRR